MNHHIVDNSLHRFSASRLLAVALGGEANVDAGNVDPVTGRGRRENGGRPAQNSADDDTRRRRGADRKPWLRDERPASRRATQHMTPEHLEAGTPMAKTWHVVHIGPFEGSACVEQKRYVRVLFVRPSRRDGPVELPAIRFIERSARVDSVRTGMLARATWNPARGACSARTTSPTGRSTRSRGS